MKLPDETIMAYVDGELDAEGMAAVERAMREDPAVAAAVATQRRLRERLQQAYAPVLEEAVPERLLAAARGDAAASAGAGGRGTVASLDAAREARVVRRGWRGFEWAALAASFAIGVLIAPWLRPEGPPALLQISGDGMVARGELAQALDARLPGEGDDAIALGLSFRSREGNYCRTFVLEAPHALAGLACRDVTGWRVTALGESVQAGGELRLAASPLPPAVLSEVDARLDGDPLDAAGERAAREAGWR